MQNVSTKRSSNRILNVLVQCDYKNSLKLPSSSTFMQSLSQSSNNLWNWCFLMSSNLQSPLQLLKFFTRTLQRSVRQLDPLEHKNFKKTPQDLWRWNEIIHFTLERWFTQSISLNEPTYNPYITLAIYDSRNKVILRKNVQSWRMYE
jgi:hypothetical protein